LTSKKFKFATYNNNKQKQASLRDVVTYFQYKRNGDIIKKEKKSRLEKDKYSKKKCLWPMDISRILQYAIQYDRTLNFTLHIKKTKWITI
jgi:hypothetical protein